LDSFHQNIGYYIILNLTLDKIAQESIASIALKKIKYKTEAIILVFSVSFV